MMMTKQDVKATPPYELNLEHKIVPDIEEAPEVDGKKPLHYQFYANGELLETVTDDVHSQGDVGLGAGSGSAGAARIQFDDFVATRP